MFTQPCWYYCHNYYNILFLLCISECLAGWWMYSENETDNLNTHRKGLQYLCRCCVSIFPPIKVKKIAEKKEMCWPVDSCHIPKKALIQTLKRFRIANYAPSAVLGFMGSHSNARGTFTAPGKKGCLPYATQRTEIKPLATESVNKWFNETYNKLVNKWFCFSRCSRWGFLLVVARQYNIIFIFD